MPTAKKVLTKTTGSHVFPPNVPKPVVHILFYTDDNGRFGVVDDKVTDFGVGTLRELIESNVPSFVDIKITFVNRLSAGVPSNFLTSTRLRKLDEVWFFGTTLSNIPPNQMKNELLPDEVLALGVWMKNGGVLMTGDHANPKSKKAPRSLNRLLNLGRAIGHRVPRAGQLRRWEGPPGEFIETGNFNTHENPPGYLGSLEDLPLDTDHYPQILILKKYCRGEFGSLTPFGNNCRPHPLFCGKNGAVDVFPDHMHEGELLIPEPLDAQWPVGPDGSKPVPEIVARGTDKRNGNIYGMVTAYDGDAASVGRIVADSTWHHYFNYNLRGLGINPDGSANTVLSKLADYYVNLAVWLAPASKRKQMAWRIFWDMATDPHVLEVQGGNLFTIGQTAFSVFGNQCRISDLVFSSLEQRVASASGDASLPPEELLLGAIIDQYHEALGETPSRKLRLKPQELIDAGVKRAFEVYDQELDRVLAASRKGYEMMYFSK